MTYGCHNRRPFIKSYPAPDGYWLDGHSYTIKAASVKVNGTKDCQYTLSDRGRTDRLCDGCKWRVSDAKTQ